MFRLSDEAPETFFSARTSAAQPTRVLPRVAAPGRVGIGSVDVDVDVAEEFLRLFHTEHSGSGSLGQRLARMRRDVETTGTYQHTVAELAFGVRVAWRNSARCIGRLHWDHLEVRDLRDVHTADEVAAHCVEHLRAAANSGDVRPVVSVFPPEQPGRPAPRIWNEQLIRYAGYERTDGSVLGDPRYREFTSSMIRRGWRPPSPRGPFDVLPLVVETADDGVRMFNLPEDAVREVPLRHPELSWFVDLGLRWHAVPAVSRMRLSIGGISYPAAPFNGWHMGTEIGARSLADANRYNLVPLVAERMGLDVSREDSLWRDRALVELNRAVLYSFAEDGVTITDHHTESRRFVAHLQREEAAGRTCPVDRSWIVPPMSGSQTPVFHHHYEEVEQRPDDPGFRTDDEALHRALHGEPARFE
ncbi:nitric oxide synthase oxygenase [Parasphingorhabdus pacifica]